MSSPLGIATVTYVLKDLLRTGLIRYKVSDAIGGSIEVSALPPDHINTTLDTEERRLNLFLYQVALNPGWRNEKYPAFNSQGERVSNPPLALDLHYFLTSYGAAELNSDILLGYGMQLFHERPVLDREFIKKSLTLIAAGGTLPDSLKALATSELAEQVERISIIPETLSSDEISKLWTAFQVKYRPGFSYRASVLLIESRKSVKAGLPVQERKVYAVPLQKPFIDKVMSRSGPGAQIIEGQKILSGYQLVLVGSQLKNDNSKVNVSGIQIIPAKPDTSDSQIIFQLPDTLQAGIQSVEILQEMLMGSPPLPHKGMSSNVKTFLLSPTIELASATNVTVLKTDFRAANIHIKTKPAIGETQQITLLLNEFVAGGAPPLSPPSSSLAYSFQVKAKDCLNPLDPLELIIPISGVKVNDYLVRIQVDTAESPVGPGNGQYSSPKISIQP